MLVRLSSSLLALLLLAATALPAAAAQYRLQVDGLACPFCAYGIEKELLKTDGVENVRIDIDAGAVLVTTREGTAMSQDQADRIVQNAGFTLRGFDRVSR
jgi:mercuric ion binding protein